MTCKVTNFFSISAFAEAFIHCYKEGMKRGYAGNPIGTDFTCHVGDSVGLSGSHFPLTIAADYQWSISDEGVATISEDGTVKGVAPGSATITLTCYGKTATCVVYVRG